MFYFLGGGARRGMARGVESLATLSSLCSMDSTRGGHSDNCKFWLLDLGTLAPSLPAVCTERETHGVSCVRRTCAHTRTREHTLANTHRVIGVSFGRHLNPAMHTRLYFSALFLALGKWESHRFDLLPPSRVASKLYSIPIKFWTETSFTSLAAA